MSASHIWVYRKEPEQKPVNSIVEYLDMPISLANEISPIADICKRRSYLQIPVTQGYIGIASSVNMEHYQPGVELIQKFIDEKKPILIWGDYDVDGMTATSVMFHCLKTSGADVQWAVPNRLDQGYGIDADLITSKIPTGSLVITVDNGISDIEPVIKLIAKGYSVLITDHHLADTEIPKATCIVNPKVSMTESMDEYIAPGVYVSAKIALNVARKYAQDKWRQLHHFCCCMTALGIVSDVIDLNHTMRMQLLYGLTELSNTRHAGLKALLNMCGMRDNQNLTATFLAYSVVPKLNAAGRMGQPASGVEILLMEYDDSVNYTVSLLAANSLKYLNADRKIIEGQIFDEAKAMAQNHMSTHPNTIVIFKQGWHPGVLGIVAARLAETFFKPSIVLTNEQEMIKGSGRSVDNFDLHGALKLCESELISFGGHTAAAGVQLDKDHIVSFQKKFEEVVASSEISSEMTIEIDADVSVTNLYDVRFQMFLENFEPVGKGNPELIFKLPRMEVVSSEERRDALYLVLKDQQEHTLLVSKYRAPNEYKNLIGKIIEILISPSFVYFSGSTAVEWKIQSIKTIEE